jgi:GTPase SAR1 family protein
MADQPVSVYFVGTAGAGKSTLVSAYDRWAKQHGISTVLVNLDPGAEKLPYTPDVDIRDWVKISEIMEDHGLGPNGAQIAAADMIALNLAEVEEEVNSYRADQILVDTPGQVELFVFRQSGKHIVETLNPQRSVIAYLMDPFLARTPSGFASQMMLAATTAFRFNEPMVFLLSKADRIDAKSIETIRDWASDPAALEHDILGESPSMQAEFAAQVSRLLTTLDTSRTLVAVSSQDSSGLDDVYTLVQGAVGESEDVTPEYDTFLGSKEEPTDADPADEELN